MTIRGHVQVDGGDRLEAARLFLRGLVENHVVDGVLVPLEGAGHSVMPALVRDPAVLSHANPFAPVMAINSARLVSMLTREDSAGRLGAVLRPCEIRAVIELVKFNQAKVDKLVMIGADCLGTFSVTEYGRTIETSPDLTSRILDSVGNGGPPLFAFRTACRMCEQPTAVNADISLGFIGVENRQALLVEAREDLAAQMRLEADGSSASARERALEELVSARTKERDAELERFRADTRSNGGVAAYLADCMECTNCMNACPICYCKECFFRSSNAERAPRDLLRSAGRQGSLAMPPDAVLFQITRLNHMATSCVGCGMCEAACPHHIPLTAMFRAVGARVQKRFGYVPGADVNDKPPFMQFKPDEFLDIGRAER